MAETTLLVDFEIRPGKLDDFKAAAAALFERTQGEPGTLRYEYFLSDDGVRNVNIEVFRDADDFVYHNRNVADLVPALLEAVTIRRIDIIGDANDELYGELEGIDLKHFEKLGGITR
jgi:quinol monooxygenase YgiN